MKDTIKAHGICPETALKYLQQTHKLQRINFEVIKPTLSPEDQDQAMLLQGELLIMARCCH